MQKDNYYTTKQAAEKLGISRVAVFKRIKDKKLNAIKHGKLYFIPKQEIDQFIGEVLTKRQKQVIDLGVMKTVHDYGQALEMLGKE